MKKSLLYFLLSISFAFLVNFSCTKKKDEPQPTSTNSTPSTTGTTSNSGTTSSTSTTSTTSSTGTTGTTSTTGTTTTSCTPTLDSHIFSICEGNILKTYDTPNSNNGYTDISNQLRMTAYSSSVSLYIDITLTNVSSTGTFTNGTMVYRKTATETFLSSSNGGSFQVNITSFNKTSTNVQVAGTFNGNLFNSGGSSNLKITGAFNTSLPVK